MQEYWKPKEESPRKYSKCLLQVLKVMKCILIAKVPIRLQKALSNNKLFGNS